MCTQKLLFSPVTAFLLVAGEHMIAIIIIAPICSVERKPVLPQANSLWRGTLKNYLWPSSEEAPTES